MIRKFSWNDLWSDWKQNGIPFYLIFTSVFEHTPDPFRQTKHLTNSVSSDEVMGLHITLPIEVCYNISMFLFLILDYSSFDDDESTVYHKTVDADHESQSNIGLLIFFHQDISIPFAILNLFRSIVSSFPWCLELGFGVLLPHLCVTISSCTIFVFWL